MITYEQNSGGRTPNKGNRTPLPMESVHVMGGNSVYNPNKSSYYGGMSPGFQTPVYSFSQREFSEHRM